MQLNKETRSTELEFRYQILFSDIGLHFREEFVSVFSAAEDSL